ncbi:MAG: hypothetical protein RLO03_13835 [Balneola sp.]
MDIDYTLDSFTNWKDVFDYESDETTVSLLDKTGKRLATFNFPKFLQADFDEYKNLK